MHSRFAWGAAVAAGVLCCLPLTAIPTAACAVKPRPISALLEYEAARACSHPLCFSTYATDPRHLTRATPADKLVPMCGADYQNRHAIADARHPPYSLTLRPTLKPVA